MPFVPTRYGVPTQVTAACNSSVISKKHAVYSVRVGIRWRALGYREAGPREDIVTWFWIGSHADYDKLVGGL